MKTEHQERVEEFMGKAGQDVPRNPMIPSEEVRLLRAKLILEEALETVTALGFAVNQTGLGFLHEKLEGLEFHAEYEPDLIEIADGCADIKVVTTGTLSACGIQDKKLQKAIDDSNLAKFKGDFKIREDGKLIKPSDWKAPDIEAILKSQELCIVNIYINSIGSHDPELLSGKICELLENYKDNNVNFYVDFSPPFFPSLY